MLVRALKAAAGVESVDVFSPSANDPRPWTFWQQWSRADIVVAPHGAGLANSIALPPWAHVIEVLAAKMPNFMFAGIALKQGLRYHSVLARDMHHESEGKVDVDEVLAAVAAAGREIVRFSRSVGSKELRALCRA